MGIEEEALVAVEQRSLSVYDTAVLLTINSGLFVYSIGKLFQSIKNGKAGESSNMHHRVSFFMLFSVAILSRCIYEVHIVYNRMNNKSDDRDVLNYFKIIDCLPTLLFVTICCLFAHFWHKVYIRFEQDEESQTKKINLKAWLIGFNIILYVIAVDILIVGFSNSPETVDMRMNVVFTVSTILMTILLSITGTRFHDRTVKWLKYMGKTVKSTKGFQTMFIVLIICLIITCCRQTAILVCRITWKKTPSMLIFEYFTNQTSYLIAHITYLSVVFFIGEFLPFLLLVRLLDSAAKKSKVNRPQEPDYRLNYSLGSMQSSGCSPML